MVDLTRFKEGITAARKRAVTHCADPKSAFLDALSAAGYKTPKILSVGILDRIDGPEDARGKRSGWYVYREIADSVNEGQCIGRATFGSWKTGEKHEWLSRSETIMTHTEKVALQDAIDKIKKEEEKEKLARNAEAAERAYDIWKKAPQASSHDYLSNKGVKACEGIKVTNDERLIIPMAIEDQIVSLQYIFKNGDKRFMTGGATKGAWFKIEGKDDTVYICEGYATGASVHEATGNCVYVAFTANNIYEVTAKAKKNYPQSRIVIAGDDDKETAGNPGRTKAEQAAQGFNADAVFPPGYIDFNDLHKEQGLEELKKALDKGPEIEVYEKENKPSVLDIGPPPGVLSDIMSYYNATSGNYQPGFAAQTALAVCSILLARSYKTSHRNYPSLFLLNVGKSSTGKEHAKNVIEEILYAVGHKELLAGDGYTSAGAVFSTLLDRPRHVSVIDEFGRYLEASKDNKRGNPIQKEANTKLMESIGRAHSVLRPPSYSSMTMKKDAADAIKNRHIHNPAITLMTMTTPSTLFEALDMGAITNGFINRFIISISEAKRDIRHHKTPIDVPQSIIDWAAQIDERAGYPAHIASEPSNAQVLDFTEDAFNEQIEFQRYCIKRMDELDRFGMSALPGRSNEMAMRISLICALARDPLATVIEAADIKWAIAYVKSCLDMTIDKLKITISHSDFEGHKKEALNDLRERGAEGITWADMQKTAPYSQHKPKDLKDIMAALKDANLAIEEPYQNPSGGRPTTIWKAIK